MIFCDKCEGLLDNNWYGFNGEHYCGKCWFEEEIWKKYMEKDISEHETSI